MFEVAISPAVNDDEAALASPFVKCLVRLIRAQDSHGSWDGTADGELLADFIVSKEQRRTIPIIGDPDPDVLWRLDKFYTAVALAIEERSGLMASPMIEMSHEGFGRVLFTAGRLVVLSRTLRDAHRFGFETFCKLAAAGTKLVDDAIAAIDAYPEVARA
ncbi:MULTISPECIES: NifX-associated nitrogen fixation protein [Mesorhizobium]|uniref:NifX-associated nitrogen fixation protein n=4 Tax=Mesorhizobium TaxID=68287 RepID=A0ABZ0VHE8_9HYPH|nr:MULTISPECIES: NifX-associated nitrogen fixation protein [Mesorhizobium]MBZ9909434.1 NifX-associated nitrogen fixation protein [Mesorhizobium sp. BR115XR7A]QGX80685.1 NifX-associated nitrogen fixation protein [Mesorhizobium japonicum R7A]QJF04832.1 NifX-associated nitrogen fixation protein [Mesorhizobium japonicum R7A]QJF10901.1 NifX-associated nitrogen fixation protein [Mesorhizobium japonicum]QJI86774.1 NifX-associated nitrogen fixation protein [Mesorhizobium japonicum]